MKVETEIKKWGNSLALRVSGIMAELPGFKAGSRVLVEVSEDGLVIKPIADGVSEPRLPYAEKDLLAGLNPSTAHGDELAKLLGNEVGDE